MFLLSFISTKSTSQRMFWVAEYKLAGQIFSRLTTVRTRAIIMKITPCELLAVLNSLTLCAAGAPPEILVVAAAGHGV
jgi:hypothetical protein